MNNPDWTNPCSDGGERLDFGHLGGTSTEGDPDSWYPELWDWLVREFGLGSVLDVGCGVGHAQKFFFDRGLLTWGLDCEGVLARHLLRETSEKPGLIVHDLTTGPWGWVDTTRADLVWCCEVAEHVEEQFVDNVVRTVADNCYKVLAFCAAPAGAGGFHHVNCQDPPYWVAKLEAAGLTYRPDLTDHARSLCPEGNGRSARNYFRRSGLIFTRVPNA